MQQATAAKRATRILEQLNTALTPMLQNNTLPDQVAVAMRELERFVNNLNGYTDSEYYGKAKTAAKSPKTH